MVVGVRPLGAPRPLREARAAVVVVAVGHEAEPQGAVSEVQGLGDADRSADPVGARLAGELLRCAGGGVTGGGGVQGKEGGGRAGG